MACIAFVFMQEIAVTRKPEFFDFPSFGALPGETIAFAEFAARIAAITEKLVEAEKLSLDVAIDGLKRLRADLIGRGADDDQVQPIDLLLRKYHN